MSNNGVTMLLQSLAVDSARLGEPDMLLRILAQVGLFVASAFFSGSETALFSLSRSDLRQIRREGGRHAEAVHALLDQPRRLIISVLCGNELVNVALTANMTGILVALYGAEKGALLATILMVPLLLLLGEATPKTIAVTNPVGVSTQVVARPLNAWVTLIAPLASVIRRFADRITTAIVGEERTVEHILQVDEFRMLVEEGVVRGELSPTERVLIDNLILAGGAEIAEILTPRTQVCFVDGDDSIADIVDSFMDHRKNRVPVFRDNRDNVVGFLHAEDILQLVLDDVDLDGVSLADILQPPVMVPPTRNVDEMFDFFQRNDCRAACVLNEFGGIDGIVTMNDVLAYVFGKSPVESADDAIRPVADSGAFEIAGDMKLIDFNAQTRFAIDDPRMTTIGGVVLRHLDRLPIVGDTVDLHGLSATVTAMDDNRIARIEIRPQSSTDETTAEDV